MKNKQDKFIVFGAEIKIIYKDLGELNSVFGYYDPIKKEVYLHANQTKEEMIHSKIHELGHCLFHRLGYGQFLAPAVEEVMVEQIATCLVENFDIKLKK